MAEYKLPTDDEINTFLKSDDVAPIETPEVNLPSDKEILKFKQQDALASGARKVLPSYPKEKGAIADVDVTNNPYVNNEAFRAYGGNFEKYDKARRNLQITQIMNVPFDTSSYTELPEAEAKEVIAKERLRKLYENRDDRTYDNDEDLMEAVTKDTEFRTATEAVEYYNKKYNPDTLRYEFGQAKTESPWYKHLWYGTLKDVDNWMVGTYDFAKHTSDRLLEADEKLITEIRADDKAYQWVADFTERVMVIERVINEELANIQEYHDMMAERGEFELFGQIIEELPAYTKGQQIAQGVGQVPVTAIASITHPTVLFQKGFSQMYKEGLDKTGDEEIALQYGILGGMSEYVSDVVMLKPLSITAKLGLVPRVLTKLGLSGVTEGVTEGFQYGLLQKMAGEEIDAGEFINNMTVGGAVGMIGGGSVEVFTDSMQTFMDMKEGKANLETVKLEYKKARDDIDKIDTTDEPILATVTEETKADMQTLEETILKNENIPEQQRVAKAIEFLETTETGQRLQENLEIIQQFQNFRLTAVQGTFTQPLTRGEWNDIKSTYNKNDLDALLASVDGEAKAILTDAINGDTKAQEKYNDIIKTGNIDMKLASGEQLTPKEGKIVRDNFKEDHKNAEPNTPELKKVHREITSSVARSGVMKFVNTLSHMSYLKQYPSIANRVRRYESDVNLWFTQKYSSLGSGLKSLKNINRMGELGIGDMTLDQLPLVINKKKLTTKYGKDAKVSDIFADTVAELNVAIYKRDGELAGESINTLNNLFYDIAVANGIVFDAETIGSVTVSNKLAGESINTLNDLAVANDIVFDAETIGSVTVSDDNTTRNIKNLDHFLGLRENLNNITDPNFWTDMEASIEEASDILGKDKVKDYFPRQVDDIDGIRTWVKENDVATAETRKTMEQDVTNAILGLGGGKERSIIEINKDNIGFYTDPSTSLENYLMGVSRIKAKNEFLKGDHTAESLRDSTEYKKTQLEEAKIEYKARLETLESKAKSKIETAKESGKAKLKKVEESNNQKLETLDQKIEDGKKTLQKIKASKVSESKKNSTVTKMDKLKAKRDKLTESIAKNRAKVKGYKNPNTKTALNTKRILEDQITKRDGLRTEITELNKIVKEYDNYPTKLERAQDSLQNKVERKAITSDKNAERIAKVKESNKTAIDRIKKDLSESKRSAKEAYNKVETTIRGKAEARSKKILEKSKAKQVSFDNETGELIDYDISDDDVSSLIRKELGEDIKDKELKKIVDNIKQIVDIDKTSNFVKWWKRAAAVKYVSGPSTMIKQYMDQAITLHSILDVGGYTTKNLQDSYADVFKGKTFDILKQFMVDEKGNPISEKEFLEWIGAEMTEPDIEKMLSAELNPITNIKDTWKDYKMNKSYRMNIIEVFNKAKEQADDVTKAKYVEDIAILTAGGVLAKTNLRLKLGENIVMTGLRLTDRVNRMASVSIQLKSLQSMSRDARIKTITKIMGEDVIAEKAADALDGNVLTPELRQLAYTILAEKQPLNPGETSPLTKGGAITKLVTTFKSFALKESARLHEMTTIPFTTATHSARKSHKLYRDAVKIQKLIDKNKQVYDKYMEETKDSEEVKAESTVKYDKSRAKLMDAYNTKMSQSGYAKAMAGGNLIKASKGLAGYTATSVLVNATTNFVLHHTLVGMGFKDEREDESFLDFFLAEFVGRIFPFIGLYHISEAFKKENPAILLEGMAHAPLPIGFNILFQLIEGMIDGEESSDEFWDAVGDDLPYIP